MQEDYSYEIYSKLWDEGVKAELAKRGAEAKRVWDAEHDGRLEMEGGGCRLGTAD